MGKNEISKNEVRVIKIGPQALYEFIYEKFVEMQGELLDVNSTDVSDYFDISFDNGEFIFCALKSEDENGCFLSLPKDVNLKKIMQSIPDTSSSLFGGGKHYRKYTVDELLNLSKEQS